MKLGLLINYTDADLQLLERLKFESCELLIFPENPLSPTNGSTKSDWQRARERFEALGVEVSAVGSYTNNLSPDPAERARVVSHLEKLFDVAEVMGCDTIGTFAGRDPEKDIPDNIPAFREVFGPLAQKAENRGLKIAIEHCPMFLGWPFRGINFAYTPESWDMMFDAVPSQALGLEYDPSHLLCQDIDYVKVIRDYGSRIHHVHGKDAEIDREAVQKFGIWDARAARHRMPGLGQVDWKHVVEALHAAGYNGNIDIEGRHDPEYHGEGEEEGLRIAAECLRKAMQLKA